MELQVLEKGFDYARKRKKWVFILGAVGFASYGAYRLYHAPIVARKRMRVSKLLGALISVAEAVSESAETVGVVSGDLKDFLQSDSNELPNSLKQISKIARSQHFADSIATATRSVTEGVLRGYGTVNPSNADQTGSASLLADRVLNKMLTPSGSGFVSVVVGSFARNLVLGFYSGGTGLNSRNENGVSGADGSSSNGVQVPNWVNVVCDEKCAELIGNCVQIFVSTAVAVYLDKTMHINTYDDFFSGLTNPNHETKVKNMLVTVCNNAMETLIKTSHQVLRNPNPSFREDTSVTPSRIEALGVETSFVESKPESDSDDENENESSWISRVSSTLAVPSNRKLVLDVTGTVTFETVRSVMEFLLQTFVESIRTCVDVVREAMLEIVRYAASKSSVIVTTCLSLCLHIIQPVALGL
ncbi:protein PHLOEM PROTEIN 2-LIKE A10 [Arachis duranensis]|uniref:Protein PHLOEM PROTEIN 2-LIKE A10 n=1 Tax=Arachis duranensis TaxID=130453 RepID=A0A6P4DF36_ARADU|nr:protein PHLOEM PROTEIN 2-LIKE A10 [Arachis duranensis]